MNPRENPCLMRKETPRTVLSLTAMAAIWSHEVVGVVSSTGNPIWVPSTSTKMVGTNEAVSGNRLTSPDTSKRAVQPGLTRRRMACPRDCISWELEATSIGSHCGAQTTGCSTSASLFAMQGLVTCWTKAAQRAVPTLMRTSARKLGACFFACRLRRETRISEGTSQAGIGVPSEGVAQPRATDGQGTTTLQESLSMGCGLSLPGREPP